MAELSDVQALARHLGEFGDISITGTDPETTVAWQGEHARGTVAIEASGGDEGSTLTAEADGGGAGGEPAVRPACSRRR